MNICGWSLKSRMPELAWDLKRERKPRVRQPRAMLLGAFLFYHQDACPSVHSIPLDMVFLNFWRCHCQRPRSISFYLRIGVTYNRRHYSRHPRWPWYNPFSEVCTECRSDRLSNFRPQKLEFAHCPFQQERIARFAQARP